MSAPPVEPSACTWCGIARRGHGRQYADAVGWHEWAAPSDAQILARMKARRLALTVARQGALPVPVGPDAVTRVFAPVASLREPGGEFDAYLRHAYLTGHDLPETGGAAQPPGSCKACGSVSESWCPDCAACERGCFGGFDGNPCTHSNASWGGV